MTTEDPKTEIEVPRPGAPEPKPSGRRWTLKKIGGLIAAFAATGTVLAGLAGYWTTYRTITREILAPVKPGPTAPRLSVVVLPFSNLTGDAAQDYLGDVITEELTTSLSRIPHSFVIARSTAFTYKGKAVDVRQIGRDLGVRYILEGSQEQGGNRVRVNAQLIDADTGAHLWADQFDADRTDLLDMLGNAWLAARHPHRRDAFAQRERHRLQSVVSAGPVRVALRSDPASVALCLHVGTQNCSAHRDATAILQIPAGACAMLGFPGLILDLVAYRHGLRASEVVVLRWDDIDLATGRLHVRRAKGGDASVQVVGAHPGSVDGQGGRGCEIQLSHSFPHAAALPCTRRRCRLEAAFFGDQPNPAAYRYSPKRAGISFSSGHQAAPLAQTGNA